jgi:DNA (cytosine-5)-methyltransferase 1
MNTRRLSAKKFTEASDILELFTWWYPGRLVEETNLNLDRVKYICKLAKEFQAGNEIKGKKQSDRQREILSTFLSHINTAEYRLLANLLPNPSIGEKFDFIDLFAGIGGLRKPFSDIGGRCVLTCEWDAYAQKTYKANWKDSTKHKFISDIKTITQPTQDKLRLTGSTQKKHIDSIVPKHDLLLAGFPCQPFSIAGVSKKNSLKRLHGFHCEDQGQLFFDICRILAVKQPSIAILENVKNLKSHNKGDTFKTIKEVLTNLPKHQELLFASNVQSAIEPYWVANLDDNKPDPKIVDAGKYVPQHRERIVLICIRKDVMEALNLNEKIDLRNIKHPKQRATLEDVLLDNSEVPASFTLSEGLWQYLQDYAKKHRQKGNGFGFGMVSRNSIDTARTLSARYYKDGSEILISQDDLKSDAIIQGRPRKMTPQECARLMGFVSKGQKFNIPVSNTRAYKQFGNSVVVPVFKEVAKLIEPHIKDICNIK